MNDIHDDPAAQKTSAPGRDPRQDLTRLRRSSTDRYIAGVAGGLGRHFNIDPNIVRVLLVVLTFFGGAGLLIYGAVWLLVPEDHTEDAPIRVGGDSRTVLLLVAAAVALLLVLGDAFSGFDGGWAMAVIALVVAAVLIARDRRNDEAGPPSVPAPGAPVAAHRVETVGAQPSGGAPVWAPPVSAAAPPAWQPPPRPALVQPSPRRTGIIWFWPTLAMIAIGLGVLAIVDQGVTDVPTAGYPALALGITAVMLLVGAFVGRPGGLILIGVVSALTLSAAAVLGDFHFDARTIEDRPLTAAAVQPEYTAHNGRIELDLTRVADPQALAGRQIDLSLNAGELIVYVPRTVNVDIDAEVGFAGGINVPGYDGGGINDSVERRVAAVPSSTSQPLDLDLDVRVGQITVEVR